MRTRICGTLKAVDTESVTVTAGPFDYEVLVPDMVRRRLQNQLGNPVELHTIEYIEGNAAGGRMTPRLVGFLHTAEREFFEMFCSVDGVGVKKALRAMVRPVADIALDIEQQNTKGLAALPGIGPATAERIVAKLRRKMSRFALLVTPDSAAVASDSAPADVVQAAYEALVQLGHAPHEARQLVEAALKSGDKFSDVEGLLQAVFKVLYVAGRRT
ncbi:MAG: Holliday junction ATP-dependent DNA helicase RuvA [Pirellulaceae bacterium]|nr:MAG: Holliday junction ATP-dependent DNA helicase RuvA [Pirellulaceae bacterium]